MLFCSTDEVPEREATCAAYDDVHVCAHIYARQEPRPVSMCVDLCIYMSRHMSIGIYTHMSIHKSIHMWQRISHEAKAPFLARTPIGPRPSPHIHRPKA